MQRKRILIASLVLGLSSLSQSGENLKRMPEAQPVELLGGMGGIGFDDLAFATQLNRVLVPGGQTGNLFLIDPNTKKIDAASGFSPEKSYGGGHGEGITSADEGSGMIFATERTNDRLVAFDPSSRKILESVHLADGPDYVRYVAATSEVWVTEPGSHRIEVFKLSTSPKISLSHSDFIDVPGGPESLIVDNSRNRAYTHLWSDMTLSIDIKKHRIVARRHNGCKSSRGIALDPARGFLFVGCREGKAVVLDVKHNGQILGEVNADSGVDVISYNPKLSHLYLPAADSATMAIVRVSPEGRLSSLGIANTAKGAHCAVADDQNQIWVCDPDRGQLLLFIDSLQ